MTVYRLGAAIVDHGDGRTATRLPGGGTVTADWTVQDAHHATADEYGVPVELMNRQHDLAHSIMAAVLGLPASPTLVELSGGGKWPLWWREEAAVLALQGLAHAAGVDLEKVAEGLSR